MDEPRRGAHAPAGAEPPRDREVEAAATVPVAAEFRGLLQLDSASVPGAPPSTPNPDHSLDVPTYPAGRLEDATTLAGAIRAMPPRDVINVSRLRGEAAKRHIHDHRGMTGSA
jgi:hypothetical protein